MALAVVQTKAVAVTLGTPGTVALDSTPTVGNLVLVFLACNCSDSALTFTSDWTVFNRAYNSDTNVTVIGLYRYVQSGDTSTLPTLCSAGSTYHVKMAMEISGVSGTWNTDFISCVQTQGVTVGHYAPVAGALMIAACGFYNGTNVGLTLGASWTMDQTGGNHPSYGQWGLAHQFATNKDDYVEAAFSGGTGSPNACMIVALATSRPTDPYVRQVKLQYAAAATLPKPFELPIAPRSGSLLVAMIGWSDNASPPASAAVNAAWTEITRSRASKPSMLAYYKYCDGTDAASAALISSGSFAYAAACYEVRGIGGVFSGDLETSLVTSGGGSAPVTTTASYATISSNDLALLGISAFDSGISLRANSYANFGQYNNFSAYGSFVCAFRRFPAALSNPQTQNNSTGHNTDAMDSITLIFRNTAVPSSGAIGGSVLRLFPVVDGKREYPTPFDVRGFPAT